MAHERVERVADVMKEGDEVDVKVLSVERDGKIRLTRRELLPLPEGEEGERARERIAKSREAGPPRGGPPSRGGRPGGDRDRGGRPGGGGGRDRGPAVTEPATAALTAAERETKRSSLRPLQCWRG